MSIGKRIKDLRLQSNLTLNELAEIVGVSPQAIFKYENEIVTNIPLSKIEKLATALETTPEYLMGWESVQTKDDFTMFGERLRELRIEKGMSQEELANIINISKSTIGMYEQGNRIPKADATLRKLAEYFDVSIDYLMGFSEIRYRTQSNKKDLEQATIKTKDDLPPHIYKASQQDYIAFPVIGDIAAGFDSIAVEDWNGETVDIPTSFLGSRKKDDFFVLRVKGDSMFPKYEENDLVLILKQPSADHSGQICAVMYDNECATLKKIEYKEVEDWLKLVPINPTHVPKTIRGADLENCRILGIPRVLIRKIRD